MTIRPHITYGRCEGKKDSVESRNAFYAVFFYISKQNPTVFLAMAYTVIEKVKIMREQEWYLVLKRRREKGNQNYIRRIR